MSKERILPFAMATKLSNEEIKSISAAGTGTATIEVTFGVNSGTDVRGDVDTDL